LGRFLLPLLKVQMNTSCEVLNINATYKVRSQHIVDFHRNAITQILLGRIFIKIHYKALKYLLNEFKIKVILLQEKCFQTNVSSALPLRLNTTLKYVIDF